MKRILLSLLTVGTVSTLVFGVSRAFFSDTETSVGNTFVAGAIDLLVDSEAHYAGLTCTGGVWVEDESETTTRPDLVGVDCDGTWDSTDLSVEKFFNLTDLKPGDEGENTLSLTVQDNDAYACVLIHNMQNDDNGLTEPESEVDATDGAGNGELAQNLYFTSWLDQGVTPGWQGKGKDEGEGDNVWQFQTEPLLFTNDFGPASDVLNGKIYRLADSTNGQKLVGGETNYLGLRWCAGTMTVDDGTGVITCDGAGMGNDTQTDLVTADMTFYVEQVRNNSSFDCNNLELPTPTPSPEASPV